MACSSYGIVRIVSVAAVLGLTAEGARAGESSVGAYVGTRVAQTDNLFLTADDQQRALITEVSTGINLDRVQERLNAHVKYDVQGIFYNDDEDLTSDNAYYQLDARATLAVIRDRLFLDAFSVHDQALIDPTATFSFDNLTSTTNRTDVALLGLSPSVSLDFGENVVGELRYTATRARYDDAAVKESNERSVAFNLGNFDDQRGGTWELAYDRQQFEYDVTPDVRYQTLRLELGYWIGPAVRVFTTQGLESDYSRVFASTGEVPGLDEHFWEVGAEIAPNERTDVSIMFGERGFGDTRGVQASYDTRHGAISVSYTEEPSSFLRDQARGARASGELAPIDSLDGPAGNPFYLSKRWDASWSLERGKSQTGFRAFQDSRFDMAAAVGGVEQLTEKYRGTEIWVEWDVTVLWSATVFAQAARRASTVIQLDDKLGYLSLESARRVGRKGEVSFTAARQVGKPVSGVGEYSGNQIIVAFQRGYGAHQAGGLPARYSGIIGAGPRR